MSLLLLFRPSTEPAVIVTGRFNQPSPTGGMDPGSPTGGFDPGSPSGATYDPPSPS